MCKIDIKKEEDEQKIHIRVVRSEAGRKGGLVKTAKGFAKLSKEQRVAIATKASKKAAELRTKRANERKAQ